MQTVGYIGRTILLFWLPYLVLTQRTFMRTCECEYVTNGKCAYTLLLPIGEAAAAATCDSNGLPNTSAPSDLSGIQSQLDRIQNNLTTLKDWNTSQDRLLSQLQGAIISMQQGMNTQLPMSNSSGDSPKSGSNVDLNPIIQQIGNLGSNIDALRESQNIMSRDMSSINAVLTDTVQRVRAMQEETPVLREKIRSQNQSLEALRRELYDVRGQLCVKRGLLVSGIYESIPDQNITASSSYNADHGPVKGRLNNTNTPGAWCPKEPNDAYEWLQFDLGSERIIFGTASKGRYDFQQWVTSYRVEYATAAKPNIFHQIVDVIGDPKIFPGNTDRNSVQTNLFWTPILARLIRIIPIGVFNNANKCMRADVIGCVRES